MRTNRGAAGRAAILTLLALSWLAAPLGGPARPETAAAAENGAVATAAEARSKIDLDRTVALTSAQEALRRKALTPLPAPCCSTFSMATCCCPCNLARSIWGVSKEAASREGANVETIREAVLSWIDALNPSGYTGEVCATGGCGRAFGEDGCGGMGAP